MNVHAGIGPAQCYGQARRAGLTTASFEAAGAGATKHTIKQCAPRKMTYHWRLDNVDRRRAGTPDQMTVRAALTGLHARERHDV